MSLSINGFGGCLVCQKNFNVENLTLRPGVPCEGQILTDCGHVFHVTCLRNRYDRDQNTCPIDGQNIAQHKDQVLSRMERAMTTLSHLFAKGLTAFSMTHGI